jgi:hypothetical protein
MNLQEITKEALEEMKVRPFNDLLRQVKQVYTWCLEIQGILQPVPDNDFGDKINRIKIKDFFDTFYPNYKVYNRKGENKYPRFCFAYLLAKHTKLQICDYPLFMGLKNERSTFYNSIEKCTNGIDLLDPNYINIINAFYTNVV